MLFLKLLKYCTVVWNWGLHGRETLLLRVVDPSLVVTFTGTPVCPGHKWERVPSKRGAVLEIKVSNEGCARKRKELAES